jgi:O-antigen ligase
MRYVYNNVPVFFIALSVSLLAWLYGGADGPLIVKVCPWLLLLLLQTVFFFPQRRERESLYDARENAWEQMRRDPFVWISVSLIFLLAIPFLNDALCPTCDAAAIAQGVDPSPRVKFLPFCISLREHFSVFLWIATALVSAIATRHCLRGGGKRLLLKILVWNASALAVLGFVQIACSAPGPLWMSVPDNSPGAYFSTWGYPNMAGCYFVAMFAIAIGLWRRAIDEAEAEKAASDTSGAIASGHHVFWKKHLFLIPAFLFFFAALNTLSRAAFIFVMSLFFIFFVHAFFSFTHKMTRARRVKCMTITLFVIAVVAVFAVVSIPDKFEAQVDSLNSQTMLNRVTGKGVAHSRIALELWRENTLFGCGGWGYRHFCVSKMTENDKNSLPYPGNANVHNDYLQFLVEHGCVGLALMVLAAVCLVVPVFRAWKYLLQLVRFAKTSKLPPKPIVLFVLPSPVFCLLLSPLAVAIHASLDCPLRTPAILVLVYTTLAAIPGFLPRKARNLGVTAEEAD